VEAVFKASGGTYGSPRIQRALAERGLEASVDAESSG
jgi:hypothetical protein